MSKKKSKNKQKSGGADVSSVKRNSALRKISARVALPILALLLAGIALWFYLRPTVRSYKNYNVLIITIDTLRADHLPAYGYRKVSTPNLDQLAQESILFKDAISHAPMTLPAHTSIMTGMLPIGHGIRDNSGFMLDSRVNTLAEILKRNGYSTAAFVSSFVLDSRWKLDQGFDLYFDNFGISEFQRLSPREIQRPAAETETEFEHWLDQHRSGPFFGWVHFYDPHDPYDPPEPYKSIYEQHPYDGEIAYTDEILGRLRKKLEASSMLDRTLVIVTADHGEGLGEHSEISHAMFVYNTTQHVPLLIRLPEGSAEQVAGIARHIDIAPTVLDLLEIPASREMQGKSLVPMIEKKEKTGRIAYSESIYSELHYGWSPLRSITTSEYKYIEAPRAELYDRRADAGELRNLIAQKREIARALKDQLADLAQQQTTSDLAQPAKMDLETEEKLRSLGYVSSTVVVTEKRRSVDPKDKIHLAQAMQMAQEAVHAKENERALQLLAPVLKEEPEMIDAHLFAAVAHANLSDYDKAIDELLRTLSYRSDYTQALYNLGWVYQMKGDLREAEKWYRKVLSREDQHLMATIQLARVYRKLGESQNAEPQIRKAARWYADAIETTKGQAARSELYATLGELYFSVGELEKAELNLKTAIDLTPEKAGLHFNLAQIYEAKQDLSNVILEYEREAQVSPGNFKVFMNLGLLYMDLNRLPLAAEYFQKTLSIKPGDSHASYLLAKTYFLQGTHLDQAKALAEQSVQVDSDFKKGYLLLSSIYRRMGKEKEAYAAIRKADQL